MVYALGVVHLAIQPGLRGGGWATALGYGALLGLVATYDLTNLATLRGWPIALTIVDIAWGTVLTTAVAAGTCIVVGRFVRAQLPVA